MPDPTNLIELAPVRRSSARLRGPSAPTRRAGSFAVLALALCAGALGAEPAERATIAVLEFDYVDSSGEPTDQTATHRAQLATFMRSVRSDLESRGPYRVVPLTCDPNPCSSDVAQIRDLVDSARKAGIKYVLLGGFHKASTLVQWARAQVIDVAAERLAFDRLLSFRGDDDRAWQRTEAFLVQELLAADLDEAAAAKK
jgi:hypothetical protein